MINATKKIIHLLDDKNIYHKIHVHEEIPNVEIAKQKVDFNIDQCLKTVAFECNDKYFFASILAEYKIDYSKLCRELNISRSKLKKANSLELEKKYGYENGGIAPISLADDIFVLIDNVLDDKDTVYCGSGSRNKTLELKYGDLTNLNNVKSVNISKGD